MDFVFGFAVGVAAGFALTRIANHLNGKEAAAANLAWLKAEWQKRFGDEAPTPPSAP
jgi:hypothetical protein